MTTTVKIKQGTTIRAKIQFSNEDLPIPIDSYIVSSFLKDFTNNRDYEVSIDSSEADDGILYVVRDTDDVVVAEYLWDLYFDGGELNKFSTPTIRVVVEPRVT